MATPKWFDANAYMQNKLAQLKAQEPDAGWTLDRLYDAFREGGFVGAEGQYEHFVKFGAAEEVAPNAYFNADEYYAAKAKQYYEEELKQEFTGSEEQIANVKNLIKNASMNAWTHYQQFGSAEGVNPSNAFDASDYCAAKAAAMIKAGQKAPDGTDWTAEKIAEAIDDAGMSVLEHYLTFAGTGEGEVAAGSTYPVSEDEQVVVPNPGETFTLTAGVDNLVGTAGDDIFSAVNDDADKPVLGAFDSIDGGAGNDTLKITDTATAGDGKFLFPADFSMKSVENVTIATTGAIKIDLSANADVVSIKGDARGSEASTVTASGNTDVALTVAGTAEATVAGGKAVSVTAGTGATSVTGDSLTSVTIKGGGNATINNDDVKDTAGKGTTLTSVVLDGVDANSDIKGEGLTDVTVKGASSASRTVTISNAKEDHSLTVHVDGTGYQADGTEAQTVIVDNKATSMTVEASGEKSSLALTGSAELKNLTITGDAALTLGADALNALKTIDGSAANGALILGNLTEATVDVQTGSGNDSFTIKAIKKVTVDAGAGNDVVTLGAAIAAGSSIDLGAGDDTLLSDNGSVAASTKDATTVIDGGDGFDNVSASLINAGNAAQFHNFEALDLTAAVTGFDFALLTNSAIEALTLSGNNKAATINNVAAGVDLRVSGTNVEETTINVKDAASGDADAFSVTLNETADALATAKLIVKGIENLTVEATGAGNGQNTLQVTDNALQTLTITGSQDLALTFASTNGADGGAVKLIDGSAATGDLNINTTKVMADSKLGLTVKTGSGDDTITLGGKASVDAGAGDDTIISSAQGGTFTGGDGQDIFDVKSAKGSDNMVTITDFVAGTDKLTFVDRGDETFVQANVSNAQSLEAALNAAAAGNGSTNGALSWFRYGDDTYIVQDLSGDATFQNADIVVKLVGAHNLSSMTVADFNFAS